MSIMMLRERLTRLLTEEFKVHIPQFRPNSSDYQMVIFAYQDLMTWMRIKWETENPRVLYLKLERFLRDESMDLRIFVSVWLNQWLEKWRERVKILLKEPKYAKGKMERLKRAKRFYMGMKHRRELKEMVIRKLIDQGEVCMVESIADNLIIEEIARRLPPKDEREPKLNPIDIFNALSSKISRLPRERGPLIYLRMGLYPI